MMQMGAESVILVEDSDSIVEVGVAAVVVAAEVVPERAVEPIHLLGGKQNWLAAAIEGAAAEDWDQQEELTPHYFHQTSYHPLRLMQKKNLHLSLPLPPDYLLQSPVPWKLKQCLRYEC